MESSSPKELHKDKKQKKSTTHSVILNNGVEMPLLALGTFKSKGKKVHNATLTALKNGYKSIDTASIYKNETEIGEAIKQSGKNREDLFITSKLNPSEQGYEKALEAFENSIERLDVDYLDLYLIHWPGVKGLKKESDKHKERRKGSWLALEKLYKEGKCRAIGVSNFTVAQLELLINDPETTVIPAVNQVELHPRLTQMELRKYCKEKGIQIEAYSSLIKGEGLDDERFVKMAKKYNKTVSQLLLRWAVQQDIPVIPKSVHDERIIENAQLFDFVLDKEDINTLDQMNEDYHCCWDPTLIP